MERTWKCNIDDLNRRREIVARAGGPARIAKQHESGKLTARERMRTLFDDDTFVELDNMLTSQSNDFFIEREKYPGDGVVSGYGYINGRITFASSQDFTVAGGSLGKAQAMKICRVMDKAMEMRAPFISINDSGGARIEEGIDSLSGYADIFYRNTLASGIIPQISVILGPCAGGACYSPAITDFVFMTDKNSQMFITGPAVVKAATGEVISSADLGGAIIHSTTSGVAHFVYPDDLSCLNGVRQLLSYLPQNHEEKPMIVEGKRIDKTATLSDIVPVDFKMPYDVRNVINTFVDECSFLEIQPDFARNMVIGFARLDGETIGIVANQSQYMAGTLEINASDKAARFIRFCDCFNIAILTLVDVPAFLPGSQQEHGGIIRHGAKLLYAYAEATVPKVSLIMRKAYGGAYVAMNSKGTGADVVFAWPISEIAVMGAAGAIAIIGKREIEKSEDPVVKEQELIDAYNEMFLNPYIAAEHGYVDEVILPEETRMKIANAFKMLKTKKKHFPHKKHGNIPL